MKKNKEELKIKLEKELKKVIKTSPLFNNSKISVKVKEQKS